MAKASADCIGEAHGGFASDGSDISGFSHMHDSGTGGVSLIIPDPDQNTPPVAKI